MRIQANPRALAAYGLNLDDLRTTISNLNVNTPKGNFDGPTRNYTINANDQLTDADAYKSAVIAYKNGRPVMLTDVANIVQGAENTKLGAWVEQHAGDHPERAAPAGRERDPGGRQHQGAAAATASVAARRARRARSSPTAPPRSAPPCATCSSNWLMSVVLVVLVMYLFLANVYATIIPSLSVPLSLIGTLAVMYLCGFSLDNLSLMALTIATGFVVDDAIVMIENIARYVEEGEIAARSRAEGLETDRLHDHFADGLADRRADSAAVHGRRGRAPVPRIRDHAGRDDRDFGGRLAHARADDVREAAAPHAAEGKPSLRSEGARSSSTT